MNRSFRLWLFAGYALTTLLGTLLHFLYDWTNGSPAAALISAVNESTWEHMKLLFFPMLLFTLIQSRFFSERRDVWCIALRGILLGLVLVPVLFYTYNGVIGTSPDWVNIAVFFISAGAACLCEARLYAKESLFCPHPRLAAAVLFSIALLFVLFTFVTPELGIFLDPVTGTYGIPSF